MELKMKAICTAQTTKSRVVHDTIEEYRAVFARMQQHPEILRKVRPKSRRMHVFANGIVGGEEVCFR